MSIDLKQVNFLAILDFTLFPEKQDYLSHYQILDTATYDQDLKDLSFAFLELSKFNKPKDKLKTMIEKWAYFFKHASHTNEAELNSIIGDDPIIQRAYEKLNRFSWSKQELLNYDSADMKAWADQNILETAFEKVIEKGKAEGREEALLSVARSLLDQNTSIEDIAKRTNLDIS